MWKTLPLPTINCGVLRPSAIICMLTIATECGSFVPPTPIHVLRISQNRMGRTSFIHEHTFYARLSTSRFPPLKSLDLNEVEHDNESPDQDEAEKDNGAKVEVEILPPDNGMSRRAAMERAKALPFSRLIEALDRRDVCYTRTTSRLELECLLADALQSNTPLRPLSANTQQQRRQRQRPEASVVDAKYDKASKNSGRKKVIRQEEGRREKRQRERRRQRRSTKNKFLTSLSSYTITAWDTATFAASAAKKNVATRKEVVSRYG